MADAGDYCQTSIETDGCPTPNIMKTPNIEEMGDFPEEILDSGLASMGCSDSTSSFKQVHNDATSIDANYYTNCRENCSLPWNIADELCKLCVDDDEGVVCESLGAMSRVNIGSDAPDNEHFERLDDNFDHIEVDMSQRDEDGDTILHVAIISEMKPVALTLIEVCTQTCWLNIQNHLLQTALHLAVLTGQIEIVEALIKMGADVTLRDHQGNTALHLACRLGDLSSVQAIVKQLNRDIKKRTECFNMKNCDGSTCVHLAATDRSCSVLKYLLANGADINVADAKSGRTVLHNAVETNDLQLVSFLLSYSKLKIDCETFSGETPLVVAYWRNYKGLTKLLKKRGAYFSYEKVEAIFNDNS